MKSLKTEYKFLLVFGILFLVIFVFVMFRTNTLHRIEIENRKKKLAYCNEDKFTKGIEYTNYVCTIQDELGNNYTIEYPQIKEKNKDIKAINRELKKNFDEVYKSVKYNETGEKLQFLSYQKINYLVYEGKGIVSFLIENQDLVGPVHNTVNKYRVYNIDPDTYDVLETDEVKEKLKIDRDYSSHLKAIVVKMYMEKFRYDYNNELDIYRNPSIDESVQGVMYRAIDNVYMDSEGNPHFILYLFNPDVGEKVPYNFQIDDEGNTTYEVFQGLEQES